MPKQDLSFLSGIGTSDKGEALKLTATQKAGIAIVAEFIKDVKKNLDKVDSNASGNLSDSAVALDPVVNGAKFKIEVEVAGYYDYVNKGVKGWADTKGSGSKYQFKKPVKGKGAGPKTSKMVTSIRKWIIKEGLKVRDKTKNKVAISTREGKRQKKVFTDTSTRTAIIIAANVRRRGLRKTGFWDDAVTKLEQTVADKIGDAVKVDIINSF